MLKLYEVIVGEDRVVADTPATDTTPAITHVEHSDRVAIKNVQGTDVSDVIAKVVLEEGQHIEAVTKISNIDVT